MNLLIDAHVFDEIHQGTRTYIKGLYGELIARMPTTSFFFAAYDIDNLRSEIGNHPNVYFVKLKNKKFLRLLWEIPLIIRRYKIDYAHFQYISPPIRNCKHIVTTHDILFKDFKNLFPLKYRVIKNCLFWISAKRADILLTVSEYSRKSIAKHYKIPMEKIGLTLNGVSKEFLTTELSDDFSVIKARYKIDKYILYVSRIEPRKNHLFLLKAFQELRLWERNYKLIFIGKKDFSYHELVNYIDHSPEELRKSTLFLQNVGIGELRVFYEHANLFVYPSLAEGFGIPPIEAISVGTTTLCSNTTAMSAFTFLGNDLFDPYNIVELKDKILNRLLNPSDSDKVARLMREAKEKYSWSESSKNFISYLRDEEV